MKTILQTVICALAIFITTNVKGQKPPEGDSCSLPQLYSASFEGVTAKGMLSLPDVAKLKKLISDNKDIEIVSFVYTIDCGEGCEGHSNKVNGDTLTADDLSAFGAAKSSNVISFQCIVGKDKKGQLSGFKPFLFFIR